MISMILYSQLQYYRPNTESTLLCSLRSKVSVRNQNAFCRDGVVNSQPLCSEHIIKTHKIKQEKPKKACSKTREGPPRVRNRAKRKVSTKIASVLVPPEPASSAWLCSCWRGGVGGVGRSRGLNKLQSGQGLRTRPVLPPVS